MPHHLVAFGAHNARVLYRIVGAIRAESSLVVTGAKLPFTMAIMRA